MNHNIKVAALANISGFEVIQHGILDGFLFADYIICISETEDMVIMCS